jgi:hypothetical protein
MNHPGHGAATTKRRGQQFAPGDVFLVALADGTHSVGQVLRITKEVLNSVLCAFYDAHSTDQDGAVPREDHLLSVQFVTPDSLSKGLWTVVGRAPLGVEFEKYVPYEALAARGFVGAQIRGSGIMDEFMNAYYALRPWDTWYEETFFDKLLVPQAKRPANVVLTKTAK